MFERHTESTRKYAVLSFVVLAVIFIAQYVLFRNHVLGEVAPYYPQHHDQAIFLKSAYRLFEDAGASGYSALFRELLAPHAAQGKLFTVQAAAAFILLKASRLAALVPNLLYFFALQASVFYLIKRATGRLSLAFVSLGVILTFYYPFYFAGALFDFRLDFQAFCLYGIFISALASSNAFSSTRWTVVATALGFLLALLRHVALGYIGGVYFLMLALLAILYVLSRDEARKKETLARIKRVVLSGIAILASIFPFLWASRMAIYNYYGVGHYLGEEKNIRSPGETMGTNAVYYVNKFFEHTGKEGLYVLAALLAAGVLLSTYSLIKRRLYTEKTTASPVLCVENIALLVIAAVAPFLILITDLNKSPVVGAVMLTPAVLFCIFVLSRGLSRATSGAAMVALGLVAIALMALGLKSQYANYKTTLAPEKRAVLAEVTRMYLDIGDYAEKNSLNEVRMVFDGVKDYLTDGGFIIVNYEARRKYIRFGMVFTSAMEHVQEDDAVSRIRGGDVALFSPVAIGQSIYPFDKSMDAMRPALLALLEREFVKLKEYDINGRPYYLFVRPR